MALQREWETPYGITCDSAHAVIVDATINKTKDITFDDEGEEVVSYRFVIRYKTKIWSDESAYSTDKSFIGGHNAQFDIDIDDVADQYNVVKQCYENLKTLDGWENSTDC